MRFRLGNTNVTANGADGWDGLTVMDTHDVIVDHCSISWSIDECCSILGNTNTTLQWSIIDQSLVNAGHSKGAHGYGGNWGGSGASFHHNLIAHHGSRTPRLGPRPTTQLDERMDMRNNVIFNFGGNGCYGGEGMNVNIVNNYYKPGPATPHQLPGPTYCRRRRTHQLLLRDISRIHPGSPSLGKILRGRKRQHKIFRRDRRQLEKRVPQPD